MFSELKNESVLSHSYCITFPQVINVLSPAPTYFAEVLQAIHTSDPTAKTISLFHSTTGFGRDVAMGAKIQATKDSIMCFSKILGGDIEIIRSFLGWQRLTGQGCLLYLQIDGLHQARIGGNQVSGGETNHVAGHQIAALNFNPFTLSCCDFAVYCGKIESFPLPLCLICFFG